MNAKNIRLNRPSEWYARRCQRIARKVAWKVIGFKSPREYREWRDQRIRHEIAAGRRFNRCVYRKSPTSEEWAKAQPRQADYLRER
jgi:hypothetical protein